ncbi:MAG TPA: peptidase S8, partial [Niastella sp.]
MKYPLLVTLSIFTLFRSFAQETLRPVQLKSGPIPGIKDLRNDIHLTDSLLKYRFRNRYYTMIQFTQLPGEAEKQALAREGITLYDYIPGNAFMAEINGSFNPALLKRNTIAGIYTLNAASKLAPALVQQLNASMADPDKLIAVSFYGNIDKAAATVELKQAGAQIAETKIQPSHVIFIKATAAVVQKIAALPFVTYISSQQMKPVPLNYNNRATHGIDFLSASAG